MLWSHLGPEKTFFEKEKTFEVRLTPIFRFHSPWMSDRNGMSGCFTLLPQTPNSIYTNAVRSLERFEV